MDGISTRKKNWYRLIMTVDPAIPNGDGEGLQAQRRQPTRTAPLGAQVGATLTYRPAALPAGVTSSGENGILASAISAVLNVSVTNFTNNATQCGP